MYPSGSGLSPLVMTEISRLPGNVLHATSKLVDDVAGVCRDGQGVRTGEDAVAGEADKLDHMLAGDQIRKRECPVRPDRRGLAAVEAHR